MPPIVSHVLAKKLKSEKTKAAAKAMKKRRLSFSQKGIQADGKEIDEETIQHTEEPNAYEEFCQRRIRAKELKYAKILKKGEYYKKITQWNQRSGSKDDDDRVPRKSLKGCSSSDSIIPNA